MKKTILILTVATTLLLSACGSDRSGNAGNDSTINDTAAMDTATMSADSGATGTDTASMGTGQTGPDSTAINP